MRDTARPLDQCLAWRNCHTDEGNGAILDPDDDDHARITAFESGACSDAYPIWHATIDSAESDGWPVRVASVRVRPGSADAE